MYNIKNNCVTGNKISYMRYYLAGGTSMFANIPNKKQSFKV